MIRIFFWRMKTYLFCLTLNSENVNLIGLMANIYGGIKCESSFGAYQEVMLDLICYLVRTKKDLTKRKVFLGVGLDFPRSRRYTIGKTIPDRRFL